MELWCRKWNVTQFHGIPFQMGTISNGAFSNDTSVPWNSMEYSMEFHGTLVPPNEISLSSMEFHGTLRLSFYSIPCYPAPPWDIPWNSMALWSRQITKLPSSMGFHGIRRVPFQITQVLHGISWNIPWNSMELWCRQMKYHLVPWNSMDFWDCHFIHFQVRSPGLPWNIP